MLQPFHLTFEFTTDVGWRIIQERYTIDSKAMRKVNDGETVVSMVEGQSGAAFDFSAPVRTLVKLP